jgi:hypothetical protein
MDQLLGVSAFQISHVTSLVAFKIWVREIFVRFANRRRWAFDGFTDSLW